jgi:hypothetical protein
MIKIKKTGKYPLNKKTRVQRHAEPLKFQFFDSFFQRQIKEAYMFHLCIQNNGTNEDLSRNKLQKCNGYLGTPDLQEKKITIDTAPALAFTGCFYFFISI